MPSERVTGYVIGSDQTAEGLTWKVKVTDSHSHFCNQKLAVASTHDDIVLAKGLTVSFLVGAFQAGSDVYHKAIDVMTVIMPPSCMFCRKSAELALEISGSESNSADYVYTCLSNIPAALSSIDGFKVRGIRKVQVRNLLDPDSNWQRLHC